MQALGEIDLDFDLEITGFETAEIDLLIEVRSPDDAERILAGLAEHGFPARRLSDLALEDTV